MTTAKSNPRIVLSPPQVSFFHQHGYLMLEDAVTPATLQLMQLELAQWIEQSREHSSAYGEQIDGRPRFSLEPGHCARHPALRRIASPIELSDCYLAFMRDNPALDAVAQLIGPNIKFNNSKINLKHPGSSTAVKYHQDFLFEPHTNQDLIAVLFFFDDVTLQNGPLEVVPGSHLGPFENLWHDGVFTGAVDEAVEKAARSRSVPCYGPAGSACLMHTRLLHGSAPNISDSPRTLCILTYTAEDAYPLQQNHIPSRHEGELVRGEATNKVRCSDYEMVLPEAPKGASFFEQQAKSVS